MKDEKEKLNYKNINEITSVGKKIMHIAYILLIALVIYLLTLVNKEWGIFKAIWNIVSVLSPLFIGVLIAYLLNPLITRMNKSLKLPRAIATIIVYLFLLLIVYLICSYLFPIVGKEVNDLISYLPTVVDTINNFFTELFKKINLSNFDFIKNINFKEVFMTYINDLSTNMPVKVFNVISKGVSRVGVWLVSLIISFYLLIDFNRATENIYVFIPEKKRGKYHKLLNDISEQVFSFVKGTGLIALLVFIVSTLCFGLAGLKAAVFFALWNAITNIIPYIGPYIGGIPIIAVAFASDFRLGIIITIVVIAIQLVESYILHPIVMSKTMKLHPVTIIIGLLIFGHFFGIIGMVIATPVTAILKTIWLFIDDKYKITKRLEKNHLGEE